MTVEPVPALPDIPFGVVTWARPLHERIEEDPLPHSVSFIAESWRLVPGETRTLPEVRRVAEQLYGPPVDPFGGNSRVATPRVLRLLR